MAVVQPIIVDSVSQTVQTVTWVLQTGDTGAPAFVGNLLYPSVQSVGAGTGAALQGSNDGTNFGALGTAITFPQAGPKNVADNPNYVQITAPTGAGLTVIYAGRRSD